MTAARPSGAGVPSRPGVPRQGGGSAAPAAVQGPPAPPRARRALPGFPRGRAAPADRPETLPPQIAARTGTPAAVRGHRALPLPAWRSPGAEVTGAPALGIRRASGSDRNVDPLFIQPRRINASFLPRGVRLGSGMGSDRTWRGAGGGGAYA